jgi:hypothetical protein
MVAQVVTIFLLILGRPFRILEAPGIVGLWLVLALALVSALDYFHRFWREVLRGASRRAA